MVHITNTDNPIDFPHNTISIDLSQTSFWRPTSVQDEPETQLTQWQIYEVQKPDKTGWDMHFMGYAGYEGRVCSAIQEFDTTTMKARSRSGRVYELIGQSGYNNDAIYVWNLWVSMYGNPEVRCVTEDFYKEGIDL